MPNICLELGTFPVWRRLRNVDTSTSPQIGHSLTLVFIQQGKASAHLCLMLAWWRASEANFDSRMRHPASFPVACVVSNIHQSALWSIRIVNGDPSKDGLNSVLAHTTGRQSVKGLLVLQDASAIRRTRLACHTHCFQEYNIRSVLVVLVLLEKTLNTLAFPVPRFHSKWKGWSFSSLQLKGALLLGKYGTIP